MKSVVVTGMGAVTPIGNNIKDFMCNLYNGVSGANRLARFDAARLPTQFAAEVKNFKSEFRDSKISFAMQAAEEAMTQAFGDHRTMPHGRLSIGLGLELFNLEDLIKTKTNRAPTYQTFRERLQFLNTPSDICVPLLSQQYGFENPPLTLISACSASTDAIGAAAKMIQDGDGAMALAGGTDSMINPMGFAGFCRIGALSNRNESPQTASRPFDKDRAGFVLGEGAGFLVLEEESTARARGAKILGRILGYGNSQDAYSVSDPHPEGEGALRAMRKALENAKIKAEQISAVSAHGTGTPKNDPAESMAIKRLLGENVHSAPVFATKSMIGHLIAAGGVVETIAALECLRQQKLHHTLNLENVATGCELRHVQHAPLKMKLDYILKNSFAFGGQNACLVLGKGGL